MTQIHVLLHWRVLDGGWYGIEWLAVGRSLGYVFLSVN